MQEEQATNSLRSGTRWLTDSFKTTVLCRLILFMYDRMLVERMLQDTIDDLTDQCSIVDQAFSQRCEELMEAKTELELKLAQVDEMTQGETG